MTEADLSEESDMAAWREERGRCQRPAPPAVPGRGVSGAGWVSYRLLSF